MTKQLKALVTSGPTQEAIDPVRYISNYSSGKQGHAIAAALVARRVEVILVSGPVDIAPPEGVKLVEVQSAREMLDACEAVLPVDIAVCAAAVCDWHIKEIAGAKLKKHHGQEELVLRFEKTPDVLHSISEHAKRPKLLVGFAAETDDLIDHAKQKRLDKDCDWIVANHIDPDDPVFGSDDNQVTVVTSQGERSYERMSKHNLAEALVEQMIATTQDERINS